MSAQLGLANPAVAEHDQLGLADLGAAGGKIEEVGAEGGEAVVVLLL